jgi:SRSO17 transposase
VLQDTNGFGVRGFIEKVAARRVNGRRASHWLQQCLIYLKGQLLPGARKSMEPMVKRLDDADYQAMQQFITDSPWDPQELMNNTINVMIEEASSPEGIISIDDTSFLKQGTQSVGVENQYCGALGKIAGCQVAASAFYVVPSDIRNKDAITWPLGMELYLPISWITDKVRRRKTGIPRESMFKEKWVLALELIDNARKLKVPHCAVNGDAGYGHRSRFRSGLRERNEPYVLGIRPSQISVIPSRTKIIGPHDFPPSKGRPRVRNHLPPKIKCKNAIEIAKGIPKKTWKDIHWTEEDKALHGLYAMRKIRIVKLGREPTDEICWLLLEKRDNDELKAYYCWGFKEPSLELFAKISRNRYHIDKGYREMKDELGIDHFEGRSWNGWHHHTVLTQMAYAYLALERAKAVKEGNKTPLPTIPEIRREVVKELALRIFNDMFGIDITVEYNKGAKRFVDFVAKMT